MYAFSNITKVIIERFTYAFLNIMRAINPSHMHCASKPLKPIYLEFHFSLLNDVTLWQRKFIIYENCIWRKKNYMLMWMGKHVYIYIYLSLSGYLWCKSHLLGFVEVKLQFLRSQLKSIIKLARREKKKKMEKNGGDSDGSSLIGVRP